jgi:hypothetical protein
MTWNLQKAAIEFGVSRETLKRGLAANKAFSEGRDDYTTAEIFHALAGDLKMERTRRERAEAEKIERENAQANKELHSISEVEKVVWHNCLMPLRIELNLAARSLGPLCVDPKSAEEAIQGWVDSTLRKIVQPKSVALNPG